MPSTSQPANFKKHISTPKHATQQNKNKIRYIKIVLAFVLILIIIGILWLTRLPQWVIITSAVILLLVWVGYLPKISNATGFSDKLFWDWLQLLAVLAIPVVVAAGTLWFTTVQGDANAQLAADQQQEAALQTYLDRMTDLLFNDHLATSQYGDEVRNVARARTLTILPQLNGYRKARVIQFLHEAHLITYKVECARNSGTSCVSTPPSTPPSDKAPGTIIDMNGADLSGADLSGLDLSEVNLNDVDLHKAHLNGAHLNGADLFGANLTNADLANADLTSVTWDKANLKGATGKTNLQIITAAQSLRGTIMPDGSKHP